MFDLEKLCHAYEHGTWSNRFYLDVESGAVLEVTEAVRAKLQAIYDELGEESAEISAEIPPHLQQAHAVELDDVRFRKIPTCSPKTIATLRDLFCETVDPLLQRLLWRALDANDGAWFERILGMESAELTRWHQFKQKEFQTILTDWLKTTRASKFATNSRS